MAEFRVDGILRGMLVASRSTLTAVHDTLRQASEQSRDSGMKEVAEMQLEDAQSISRAIGEIDRVLV